MEMAICIIYRMNHNKHIDILLRICLYGNESNGQKTDNELM